MLDSGTFRELMNSRILVLDGAMGTALQGEAARRGVLLRRGRPLEMLNLTAPSLVEAVHAGYVQAGSDIIETNTFMANRMSCPQEEGFPGIRELNEAGVALARKAAAAARRGVLVAGSMGPTPLSLTRCARNGGDVGPLTADMEDAYREQAEGLSGADLLMVETVYDARNAMAALSAIRRTFTHGDVPVVLSATVGRDGRLLSGQTLLELYHLCDYPLAAFGLNCSFGIADFPAFVDRIQEVECGVCIYPNAGLPDSGGIYRDTPEYMAEIMGKMAAEGKVNLIGGCCGTTDRHIRCMAGAVRGAAPRFFRQGLFLSGRKSIFA